MSTECPMCGAMINGYTCEYCGYCVKREGKGKNVKQYFKNMSKENQDRKDSDSKKLKKDDVKTLLINTIKKL